MNRTPRLIQNQTNNENEHIDEGKYNFVLLGLYNKIFS